MTTRRTVLGSALASALAASTAHSAEPPRRVNPSRLPGTWLVSGIPSPSAGADRATLSKAPGEALSLRLAGELNKALGGPIVLQATDDGSYVGTAPTGVVAKLKPIDERRLDLTLVGKALHFDVYLVK